MAFLKFSSKTKHEQKSIFHVSPTPISLSKSDHVLTDALYQFFARLQRELEMGVLGQLGFQGGPCPAGCSFPPADSLHITELVS